MTVVLRRVCCLAVPMLLSLPAQARTEAWSGDLALGYLATTGNAEASSFNGKAGLVYAPQAWRSTTTLAGVNSNADDENAAENYAATQKFDINFTAHDYAFFAVDWSKDLYGAVRERTSETAGYGRKLLVGPNYALEAEIGAGARQEQTQPQPRERHRDAIGRAAMNYRWKFSPSSSLQQRLKVESGRSNTYVESASQLKLAVLGNVYANLSYTIKTNSHAEEGAENTDTEIAVTLSYEFGNEKPG